MWVGPCLISRLEVGTACLALSYPGIMTSKGRGRGTPLRPPPPPGSPEEAAQPLSMLR